MSTQLRQLLPTTNRQYTIGSTPSIIKATIQTPPIIRSSQLYRHIYSLSIRHLRVFQLSLTSLSKQILLFAATLNLISNELLVLLETALDMEFEADDIVEHAFDFRVEFFAERVGAELELFVSGICISRDSSSVAWERGWVWKGELTRC